MDNKSFKNAKKVLRTREEILADDNAILYDPSSNPVNLVDTAMIKNMLVEVLSYMVLPNIKIIRQANKPEYINHMKSKFPQYSAGGLGSTFKKVISGDDLAPLFSMLESLDRIKSGQQTLEHEEKQLGNMLSKKYLPKNLTK